MSYNHEAQLALNKEHRIRPQPGDYWHDMYSPILLVVWQDGEHIEYLDYAVHRVGVSGGWKWNVDLPLVRSTYEDFAKRILYQSKSMSELTWCDVIPDRMREYVDGALLNRKLKRYTTPKP